MHCWGMWTDKKTKPATAETVARPVCFVSHVQTLTHDRLITGDFLLALNLHLSWSFLHLQLSYLLWLQCGLACCNSPPSQSADHLSQNLANHTYWNKRQKKEIKTVLILEVQQLSANNRYWLIIGQFADNRYRPFDNRHRQIIGRLFYSLFNFILFPL